SLGSLSLGREKCRSLFFPACFSSALIWATSPASASSWAWVGSCPTCRPNARSRASCGPTLASRRSSRSLFVFSSRYRAVSAASRSSQFCPVGASGGAAGADGAGGWFSRFSSSTDNLCPDPEFTFHDLLGVLFLVEPVIPALHALWRGVGDVLPAVHPAHLVALALHQGEELVFGSRVSHALVDGVHQPELLALALGGGAILPGAHALGLILPFLR